ncbi:hypothetical protein A2892_01535 [Candidatus Woesebacteria bacterium RIFCSPLOWO2_01_FULL_39_10b]|uniref:Uncharacterized protein n=1 Tax=Candidatus Woesebacteria bacterium RIFCSPLOWO2_01_FULL_39_10b TaxID=1802517 RepID=A0A1F8BBI2_9BACT|nr:MAG: hypothetical protein A2892_01535 [Candidatus Woesebacteria bacterium RIFCSPLOWO2_01_FULL_39_10b]
MHLFVSSSITEVAFAKIPLAIIPSVTRSVVPSKISHTAIVPQDWFLKFTIQDKHFYVYLDRDRKFWYLLDSLYLIIASRLLRRDKVSGSEKWVVTAVF